MKISLKFSLQLILATSQFSFSGSPRANGVHGRFHVHGNSTKVSFSTFFSLPSADYSFFSISSLSPEPHHALRPSSSSSLLLHPSLRPSTTIVQ